MVELIDIFLLRKKMGQLVADRPGLGKTVVAWIIVYILYSILSLFWGFVSSIIAALLGYGDLSSVAALNLLGIVFSVIIIPIGIVVGLIFALLSDAVVFLFAKLLGGKGYGFIQFFSTSLYVSAAITLLFAIILPLFYIPFLNILIAICIFVYSLYLTTMLIKAYFDLSTIKAVLAWLIPLILLIIILIILAILLIVLIGAAFMSALSNVSTSGLASLPF